MKHAKTWIFSALYLASVPITSHWYVTTEARISDYIHNKVETSLDHLAHNLGYVRPTSDQELSPNVLCTMEAVRRGINPSFLCSLLHVESEGNSDAVSPKGALGLMQVMPFNARLCKDECGVQNPSDLFNPEKNICCGALIFEGELNRFGNDPVRAIEAYNGGPKCVGKCSESVNHRKKVLARAVQHLG